MAGELMTKIVFSDGGVVNVVGQVAEVETELGKFRGDTGFAKFMTPAGTDVYVAANRVAYIEEFSDRRT